MFEIKCDECGKEATVPFKPTVGRPVYCRTCFSEHRSKRKSSTRLNFSLNEKNTWARRDAGFSGRKEELPTRVIHE